MKHTIHVYSYSKDNQDGSGSVTLFSTLEELKENIFDYGTEEERERKFRSALHGDNPYDDGEIDTNTIVVEENDNGKWTLAHPVSFQVGQ